MGDLLQLISSLWTAVPGSKCIPLVICTALCTSEAADIAEEVGAAGFLCKPYTGKELMAIIDLHAEHGPAAFPYDEDSTNSIFGPSRWQSFNEDSASIRATSSDAAGVLLIFHRFAGNNAWCVCLDGCYHKCLSSEPQSKTTVGAVSIRFWLVMVVMFVMSVSDDIRPGINFA